VTPALLHQLRRLVGFRHVLTRNWATRPYRSAFRLHVGAAAIVVRPASLVQLWRVLEACVAARCAVILQAANTGLTGGSSPSTETYDRPVVLVSVLRIRSIFLVADGTEAVCLPGSTLNQLEDLLKPVGREPHSVIGSTCLGASITGGICNNSGGSLVQRGPAYTELSVFAFVDDEYRLQLVNHLGIDLGADPEEILRRLDSGDFRREDVQLCDSQTSAASVYQDRVRNLSSPKPARYNADTSRLYESSGCGGKVAVFAVRVATYLSQTNSITYYIGTNIPGKFTELRRTALSSFTGLPISAEYIHRSAFDIAITHGRDIYLAVLLLPTRHLAQLFKLRSLAEAFVDRVLGSRARHVHDLMHRLLRAIPVRLPIRLRQFRSKFAHHLILKIPNQQRREYEQLFSELASGNDFGVLVCTSMEANAAFQHRFAVAGAANNYRLSNSNTVGGLLTLDVALVPNDENWHMFLPPELEADSIIPLAYGHFFCHVFHLDYLVSRGSNSELIRGSLNAWLGSRGAQYPAEHNFGHVYGAPADVVEFYKALDPTNTFNPGIGKTSRLARWASESGQH